MRPLTQIGSAVLLTLTVGSLAHGATRFAKPTPSGAGDCTSWANACTLTAAIANAVAGDQVWAKSGTYGPISLKSGVKVYGGFAGTETAASQSNPDYQATIIDGAGAQAVYSGANNAATVLRGFTIRNGYEGTDDGGGGMVMVGSSAVIVQCIFENNSAAWWGGAVAIRGTGAPQFVNCRFRNNGEATGVNNYGAGAVWLDGGSPTFTNCLFYNNRAGEGGVIVVRAGNPTFLNCTLAANQATISTGGAIVDEEGRAVVRNSILWGNTAARGASQISNGLSGQTTVTYSDVQGGFPGAGNIAADPQFQAMPLLPYRLTQTSPCKNAGQNSALPADVGDLDWDSNASEQLPNDLGLSVRRMEITVDMGAFETPMPKGGGAEADQ